jgi:hypothetical protein
LAKSESEEKLDEDEEEEQDNMAEQKEKLAVKAVMGAGTVVINEGAGI